MLAQGIRGEALIDLLGQLGAHNGSAATLDEVVDFYNTRFKIHINPQQKRDLVAFLSAL